MKLIVAIGQRYSRYLAMRNTAFLPNILSLLYGCYLVPYVLVLKLPTARHIRNFFLNDGYLFDMDSYLPQLLY